MDRSGTAAATPTDLPIDVRRLAQLVALADAGTVTGAAEQLGMTPQALSSSIQQLQRSLGLVLTERSGRSLVLTAVGRYLVERSRPIFEALDSLVEGARRVDAGERRPFMVGRTPAVSGVEVFDLLAPLRRAHPDRAVTVQELFPNELLAAVHAGRVDLGLRRGVAAPSDLVTATLGYQPLHVAVPAAHPLAGEPVVQLKDLSSTSIVVWAPPGASYYTDFLLASCRRAGFEPNLIVNHIQGTPPITAVEATGAAAFVTDPPGPALGGAVCVLEVSDGPKVPIQAVWLPHTTSPERDLLIPT